MTLPYPGENWRRPLEVLQRNPRLRGTGSRAPDSRILSNAPVSGIGWPHRNVGAGERETAAPAGLGAAFVPCQATAPTTPVGGTVAH